MRHLVADPPRTTGAARCSPGACPRPLVGLHRRDLPLDRRRALEGDQGLSPGAEGSVRGQRAGQRRAVPAGRDAEPDRAARPRLPGGSGGRQRPLRRRRKRPPRRPALSAGLAPQLSRRRASRRRRSSWPRCWRSPSPSPPSAASLSGAGLSFGSAVAGFANVWPLALLFAGLGVVATGWSLRTSVVTGSVAGVLVSMYVIDLIGRLDSDLSGVRYISVFKYYGNAIEDGIEPLAFCGVDCRRGRPRGAWRLAVRAARSLWLAVAGQDAGGKVRRTAPESNRHSVPIGRESQQAVRTRWSALQGAPRRFRLRPRRRIRRAGSARRWER